MIYLVSQMALFLLLAALAGMMMGWWSKHLMIRPSVVEETTEDMFAIKHRLDTCFDENTKLRRNLKSSDDELQRLSKYPEADELVSSNNLSDKVSVLMDDLQLRDDTIIALEKELEMARSKQ